MTSFNFCQSNFFFFLLSMRKRERLWGSQAAMFPTEHRPRSALTGYKPRPRCGAQTGPSTSTSQTRQRQSPSEATEPLSPSPLSNALLSHRLRNKTDAIPNERTALDPDDTRGGCCPNPSIESSRTAPNPQSDALSPTPLLRLLRAALSLPRPAARALPLDDARGPGGLGQRRVLGPWPRVARAPGARRRRLPSRAWPGRPAHVPAICSVSPARAP